MRCPHDPCPDSVVYAITDGEGKTGYSCEAHLELTKSGLAEPVTVEAFVSADDKLDGHMTTVDVREGSIVQRHDQILMEPAKTDDVPMEDIHKKLL